MEKALTSAKQIQIECDLVYLNNKKYNGRVRVKITRYLFHYSLSIFRIEQNISTKTR